MKWTIYVLLAVVICLIPCALYSEFITPFSVWEDWVRWHDHRNVNYSVGNLPPAMRVIEPVFAALVLPPTWLAEHGGARRGLYGYFAAEYCGLVPLGGSFHYQPPALIAAAEFLQYAFPFWFVIVSVTGESFAFLRRWRWRGRSRSA